MTGGGAARLQGARAPAKGVLLFGPPGALLALTGHQTGATDSSRVAGPRIYIMLLCLSNKGADWVWLLEQRRGSPDPGW